MPSPESAVVAAHPGGGGPREDLLRGERRRDGDEDEDEAERRGLVEALGGRLDALSTPGEGSTFRFTLPINVFGELHGL